MEIMKGGMRQTSRPNGRTHIPSSTNWRCNIAIFTGCLILIIPVAPSTRISVTSGSLAAGANSTRNCSSINFTFSCQRLAINKEIEVEAIVHAKGFPIDVGPCIKHPAPPEQIVPVTGLVVIVAESVRQPLVNAFPIHMISGSTPVCSHASSLPVCPKPVTISLNINETLYRSQSSWARTRKARE